MPIRLVELHEAAPGQEVRLLNVDAPVAPREKRTRALAVVLVLLAFVAVVEYFLLAPGALIPNFLFLLGLGAVAAFVLLVRHRRLLSLHVSRSSGRIVFTRGIPGESPAEPATIPCSAVESIALRVQHGSARDGRLMVPFHVTLRGNDERVLLSEPVCVADLNRDEELLDLVVRIGRAVGLSHYHVALRDPRRFEVQATRVGLDRSRPIPDSIDETADYTANRVMAGLVLPDQVLAGFDPSMPLSIGLRIGTWDPGRSITVVPRGALLRWAGGLVSAAAAVACVWGWRHPDRLPFLGDDAWVWLVPAAGSAAIAVHLVRSASFHARVDVANGTARVRRGLLLKRITLSGVTEVVLSRHVRWGAVSTEARRGSHTFHTYRLELRGNDAESLSLLPEITTVVEGRQQSYFDALHPFSVALAAALGRPHRYVETEEKSRP